MNDPVEMGSVFGIAVYPYGACVMLATSIGCLLLIGLWKRKTHSMADALLFMILAVPCCFIFSRVGYCLVQANFLSVDFTPGFVWKPNLGGYSLFGALAGLLVAAWLFKLRTGIAFAETMDNVAPAALVVLAGERLAESLTLDGVGGYIDNPALQWFPIAVKDSYGDYVMPVFFWEATAAMAISVALLLWMRKPGRKRGDAALTGTLLLGLTQILLESLRADDYLRFGFVRVNQLLGVVMALYAIAVWLVRLKPRLPLAAGICGVSLACVGLMILTEFALDKSSISNILLYIVMSIALLTLAAMGLGLRNRYVMEETARAKP